LKVFRGYYNNNDNKSDGKELDLNVRTLLKKITSMQKRVKSENFL